MRCGCCKEGTRLLKVRDPIDLWYLTCEGERICVGRGRFKHIDLTIVHGSNRSKSCIVAVVKLIFQRFQNLMLFFPSHCGRFIGDCVGSNCFWPMKDVSWLGFHWYSTFVVENHMGLEGEEISTNVVPIKEACEVSLEENTLIFDYMEEGGSSRSERGEEYIHEGMEYVPCMKRMEWCGRKCELVNHIG